jgi:hypothetical protein
MAKGETVMPVPHGVISTSEGPVDPEATLDEALESADAEEAVEEYLPEESEDDEVSEEI